jgi:hypothetical protein
MDWPAETQAITSILGLMVTSFGFLFLSRQITLLKKAIVSDTNGRLSDQSITILNFIADKPYLYDYFYHSKPLGSADEHVIEVLCACEMIANYADMVALSLPDIPVLVRSRWTRFITDTLASSPALRDFIAQHRLWYSDELLAII